MERKKLAPGVFITTLDAEKFNRCRITIHLRYPALRRSATDAAVLPLVLLFFFSCGLGLLLSALAVYFRDMMHLYTLDFV